MDVEEGGQQVLALRGSPRTMAVGHQRARKWATRPFCLLMGHHASIPFWGVRVNFECSRI